MDGTLVPTTGECKQGMDIAYNGTWGYHPLVVSLANTGEVLSIVNRSGNRPSHEGGRRVRWLEVCLPAAFAACCCEATPTSRKPNIWTAGGRTPRAVHLRHRWHGEIARLADDLPKQPGKRCCGGRCQVKTQPGPTKNVKQRIVESVSFRTSADRQASGGVRLPAHGLPEDLSPDRGEEGLDATQGQ